MKAEQSNTSVKFGDRVIMKLYRRVEPGINPELEIGRTLTARNFRHSPSLVGALEYHQRSNDLQHWHWHRPSSPIAAMHGNMRCPNSPITSTASPQVLRTIALLNLISWMRRAC